MSAAGVANAQNSTAPGFEALVDILFAEPYESLPVYPVNKRLLGKKGDSLDNRFRQAAIRTLSNTADFLEFEHGQKLINPNGICFTGRWRMNADSPYTGMLRAQTVLPVIVRISVALGRVDRKARRAFGMAVKLFPASGDEKQGPSRNLFLLESVSGRRHPHALDAVMDNAPALGELPGLSELSLALRLRSDLNAADKATGASRPNYAFRPVDHLATIAGENTHAPEWIRLRAASDIPRIDAEDFRDELSLDHYPNHRLLWQIEAAEKNSGGKSNANWQSIGQMELSRSVVSSACDRRLHFAHPRLR